MPVLIIIGIIIIISNTRQPKRKRKPVYHIPAVYDPIKIERLNNQRIREAQRLEDRNRKEQERKAKEQEKARKAQEARQAAEQELNRLEVTLLEYRNLYEMVEQELNAPRTRTSDIIKYTEKLINLEQKIYKLEQRREKAYYTAHN